MTPQYKLKQLRIEWTKHPSKRTVIELQADIIKKSLDYCYRKEKNDLKLQADVVEELLK